MNDIYSMMCVALFLATAPTLLVVRLVKAARFPWWLVGILAALLGWIWINLATYFHYEHLDALLAAAGGVQHAPQELIDEWQNDGGPRTFAFLFGWLYGLVYLAPWLFIYGVLHAARKAVSSRRSAAL